MQVRIADIVKEIEKPVPVEPEEEDKKSRKKKQEEIEEYDMYEEIKTRAYVKESEIIIE